MLCVRFFLDPEISLRRKTVGFTRSSLTPRCSWNIPAMDEFGSMGFELVNAELNQIKNASNRFVDYYNQSHRNDSTQEERRRNLLRELRSQKRDALLVSRYKTIFTDVNDDHEAATDLQSNLQPMEAQVDNVGALGSLTPDVVLDSPSRSPVKNQKRRPEDKAPRLMLSEWLLEVPSDFEDSWVMTVCPEGKRCSVVASKGRTIVYSRPGKLLMNGVSDLPGGGPNNPNRQCYTVLDCIFSSRNNQFYVLDVLFWNGSSLIEQSAEFRLFWLRSRLSELDCSSLISDNSEYPFSCLEYVPCDRASLDESVRNCSSQLDIDGMMFCHKDGCYFPGTTPLVCWLKPFMFPEILGIPVSDKLMAGKPIDYLGLKDHLEALEKKPKVGRRSKSRSSTTQQNAIDL